MEEPTGQYVRDRQYSKTNAVLKIRDKIADLVSNPNRLPFEMAVTSLDDVAVFRPRQQFLSSELVTAMAVGML
jgi:hypothetical protein